MVRRSVALLESVGAVRVLWWFVPFAVMILGLFNILPGPVVVVAWVAEYVAYQVITSETFDH